MSSYDVFYKETNKTPCHYIPNIIQYHMTLNLTSDIQLQLGFSLKLDQLQKALLTKARCYDNLLLLSCVIIKSLPQYTSPVSHWPSSYNDLLSYMLIGLWDMQLITYSPLLFIIPRIHNLACFVTRSPVYRLNLAWFYDKLLHHLVLPYI